MADAVDSPVEEVDIVLPDAEADYSSVAVADLDNDCAVAAVVAP